MKAIYLLFKNLRKKIAEGKSKTSNVPTGKWVLIGVISFVAVLLIIISNFSSPSAPSETKHEVAAVEGTGRGFGAFGSSEERYNYLVRKTETDYALLKEKIKKQKEGNASILKSLEELKEDILEYQEKAAGVEDRVKKAVAKATKQMENKIKAVLPITTERVGGEEVLVAPQRLRIITIPETAKAEVEPSTHKYVYLPAGSFVKCTLLTGAYAPCDRGNPLPVLISINEGFYGPNMSHIPLKGTLAIGKAVADYNSSRAIIQIVSLAYVSDDGKVFETSGNLGWVSGKDGTLGIPGKIVSRKGKALTGAFASGFLSGIAEGFGQAQTTPNEYGRVVTGNVAKYAGYSGLSEAAANMSNYYTKMLEEIVTAVQIDTGQDCYLVMQKGVEIEGLTPEKTAGNTPFSGVD